MLINWGNIKLSMVSNWVERLKLHGCPYNLKNLRLSGMLIRELISTKVKQQISATISIAEFSGPELLVYTIQQRSIMSSAHICTISNKLSNLSLGDIPGERVPDLTKLVSDLARQLFGSGRQPEDLINLVSKPYTKGSVEIFKTYALGTHTNVFCNVYADTWENLVSNHSNMYYDLVQTNDYPPASGKKPEKEDKLIQGLYGQIEKKFSKMEQSLAAKLVNVVKNHKSDKKVDNNNNNKSATNWRYIATKEGKPQTKTVDGILYKFCQTCCNKRGFWTTGDCLHGTKQHNPTKAKKNNNNDHNNTNNNTNDNNTNTGNNNNNDNNSGNLAEVPDFGFDLNLAEAPEFDSFDFGLNTSVDVRSLKEMVCKPCIPSLNLNTQDNDDEYSKLSKQLKDYRGYA